MRHLVRGRKLGRTASHRKATLMSLSVALIKHERILTTLAKAKALRSFVEPIITRSKQDTTHNRSLVFRHLRDNKATSRLFDEIGPMVEDRQGGYTRIVKMGFRKGDGAERAMIELVDFNDSTPESGKKKRRRRTRRGRTGAGKQAAVPQAKTSPASVKSDVKEVKNETTDAVTDKNQDNLTPSVSDENTGTKKEKGFSGADQGVQEETVVDVDQVEEEKIVADVDQVEGEKTVAGTDKKEQKTSDSVAQEKSKKPEQEESAKDQKKAKKQSSEGEEANDDSTDAEEKKTGA